MAETSKEMRVFFSRAGEQKAFMEAVFEKVTVKKAAALCEVSPRTIKDWRRERYSIGYNALLILSRHTKTSIPDTISLKDRYWYTSKGAPKGAKVVLEKYGRIGGDPEYRLKKWREWWDREGKYRKNSIFSAKDIVAPRKSKKLAEFVGILLGDGGISSRQITVSLHSQDDKEYGRFVVEMFETLFGITPSVQEERTCKVINIVLSRIKAVEFCYKIGLKKGDKVKQQIDAPAWIKNNKKYAIACLRGLMDTDGGIFLECHNIKNKRYCYPRVHFVNQSVPLRNFVWKTLQKSVGIEARKRNERAITIEKRDDILKYFYTVGSSNPKHMHRFHDMV